MEKEELNKIIEAKMFVPESWATSPDRAGQCLGCNEHPGEWYDDLPVVIELFLGQYYKRNMGWLCMDCGNKYSSVEKLNYGVVSSIDNIPDEIIQKIIKEN